MERKLSKTQTLQTDIEKSVGESRVFGVARQLLKALLQMPS